MSGDALRVALVSTASAGQAGSMGRYRAAVAEALSTTASTPGLRFEHVDLAAARPAVLRMPRRIAGWFHHLGIWARARRSLVHLEADVCHVLDGSHAYVARWIRDIPTVLTCHDLIPLLQVRGELGPRPHRLAQWLVRSSVRAVADADLVVADSRSTRDDLVRLADMDAARIRVVGVPVTSVFRVAPDQAAKPAPDPGYILHVGSDAFYKNRPGVIRTYAGVASHTSAELVMVGPRPDRRLRGLLKANRLRGRVRFVEGADDWGLAELYRGARLLLQPSLYEGFGWPVLEAMACGCPVVCSDAASLVEVAGEAALTADAADEAGLAQHCLAVLSTPALAERLCRAGVARAADCTVERLSGELQSAYAAVTSKAPIG